MRIQWNDAVALKGYARPWGRLRAILLSRHHVAATRQKEPVVALEYSWIDSGKYTPHQGTKERAKRCSA